MGLFNFLYRVILFFVFFRPFKIIRTLKLFGMRLNYEMRPGAVAHLALAQGHPWFEVPRGGGKDLEVAGRSLKLLPYGPRGCSWFQDLEVVGLRL